MKTDCVNMEGKIVKIVSNLYTVEANNQLYDCHARGKFRNDKLTPLVGDECEIDEVNNYILNIKERKNELKRPVIANVDVALIITSCKSPDLSLYLLDKLLCNVYLSKIEPIICFTKLDLLKSSELKEIKNLKKYYTKLGIKVIFNTEKWKIKRLLKNKVVVLTGQTGAGKSTLLNSLDKHLNLKTQDISTALGRGKHTTRHVELFKIGKCLIADTPGFSALDFDDVNIEGLQHCFKEFNNYQCEFRDCKHLNEKNCKVKNAVFDGRILNSRYDNYLKFIKEVEEWK